MNQLKAVNLKFVVFILASHFLLFACTTGDQVVFDSKERAATVPEEIEVVYSNTVKREYKIIGIVTANTYSMQDALERMRDDASEMGAEALLDFAPNGSQTSIGSGNGYITNFGNPYVLNTMQTSFSTSYNTGFSAKAIVWEHANQVKSKPQKINQIRISDLSNLSFKKNLFIVPDDYKKSILDLYAEYHVGNNIKWNISVKPIKKGFRKLVLSNGSILSDSGKLVIINRSKPFSIDSIKIDSTDVIKTVNNLSQATSKQVNSMYFLLGVEGKHPVPVWTIWLYGPNDDYYGEIKIDATTGQVLFNEII